MAGLMLLGLTGCEKPHAYSRDQRVNRAEAYLEAGKFHKAFTELNAALSQDPKNSQVHLDLGWLYLYTNQVDKALAELRRVESQDPRNPHLHHLRGATLARLEQWTEALEAYEKALSVDRNNPRLHHDIATAFLAVNQPDAALSESAIAAKLDPDNPVYEYSRCMAYRQLKQYPQALHACEKAMTLYDNPDEKEQMATVLENIRLLQSLGAESTPGTPAPDSAATESTPVGSE